MIKGPHVSSIVCHTLSIEVSHISIEVKIIVTRKWCFELWPIKNFDCFSTL